MNSGKTINSITEKQARCIRILSRKTGKSLPSNLQKLSRKEASAQIAELIDALHSNGFSNALAIQNKAGNGNGNGSGINRDALVRLGLAAKLMHQKWITLQWPVFTWKEKFKKGVVELFNLLGEVEKELILRREA